MSEDKLTIPNEHNTKLYITVGYGVYNFNEIEIRTYDYTGNITEPQKWGLKLLKEIDLTIDLSDCTISDKDITDEIVSNLEAEKQKMMADYQVSLNRIQDQINKYLSLEGIIDEDSGVEC